MANARIFDDTSRFLGCDLVSAWSMLIQTTPMLISACGKLSIIDLRTARAPCTHSGHVGDTKARSRSLSLLLFK
jgi:hypothetical protein